MRNTDMVKYVGFSNGGKGTTGYKVRFAVDSVRRTKVLAGIGCTDITWFELPKDMTKADAVQYLQTFAKATPSISGQVYQDAISKAVSRLVSGDNS
jgi:hypothetical protein